MEGYSNPKKKQQLGLIGFGAFGALLARHMRLHFDLIAHDPAAPAQQEMRRLGVRPAPLAEVAACPVVVLAAPVCAFAGIAAQIAPLLRPGVRVFDVGSVKVRPAEILSAQLPPYVEIIATHPLFGPQSARDGLSGLKIALCPLRGARVAPVARFLQRGFGLEVIVTTPDRHDRDLAFVQGLTHLVAKTLAGLTPPQTRMTTRSYDLLMEAVAMVRDDAPEVFAAIERDNPYAAPLRARFLRRAAGLAAQETAPPPMPRCAPSPSKAPAPVSSSAPPDNGCRRIR